MDASRPVLAVPGGPLATVFAAVSTRQPRWLSVTSVAVLLALIRLTLVVSLPYDRAVGLFDDDAFYYFGIARHIANGSGSTFNGVDPTNGYHPLWLAVLVPIFALAHGRSALIAVVGVSAVLFVASARLLDQLGALTGRPLAVTVSAAPLLVAGATGPAFWFSGMETGLLLLALLALAVLFVKTERLHAPWFTLGWAVGLGGLMTLAVLARLDAVFPVAVLAVFAMVGWRSRGRREMVRLTLASAALPIAGLGSYLALNSVVFHTALPVSGQAKALGGGALGGESANFDVLRQFCAAPVLFGHSVWLGALSLFLVPAAVVLTRGISRLAALARFGLVVLLGGMLTVSYYAGTSSWTLWPWYFYAAPLALALAGPALIDRLGLPRRMLLVVAAATCVATLTVVAGKGVWVAERGAGRSGFVEHGPAMAARVAGFALPGVPLAMGDRAGSFGYHLDRPLVHLEGLVNSAGYLDALRADRVGPFLAARRVGYYVRADMDPGHPISATGPVCRAFTEPQQGNGLKASIKVCDADLLMDVPLPDGTAYRVWRYRFELNP